MHEYKKETLKEVVRAVDNISNKIGEIQESPTANTILHRLESVATSLANSLELISAELQTYRNTALTNTAVSIKSSSGSVMGWNFINLNTTPVYIKFFDLAAGTVVVGTSEVALTILVPPSDGITPGMFILEPSIVPFQIFQTAISMTCTTGLLDTSNIAPLTSIHASIIYK